MPTVSELPEPSGSAKEAGPPRRRSASRTLAYNAASNWALMGLDSLVRLYLLGYLFPRLGREDYGIYQLALAVTAMTYFLRFGLMGSVVRLAGEHIAARDWQGLAEVLSVVRTLVIMLGGLAWGVAVVASLFFLDALGVPEASRGDASALLQFTGLSAAFHIVSIVYMGTLCGAQRHYLSNAVLAGASLVRVAVVVAVFGLGWGSLAVLGACLAVPDGLVVAAMAVSCRRFFPEVRLAFRRFTRAAFRRVMGFSLWFALANIVRVVQANIAVPLVSSIFGAAAVPLLAVPRQLAGQMMRLSGGLTLPVRPLATQLAIEGRRDQLGRLYRTVLRFSTVLLVLSLTVLLTYGHAMTRILTNAEIAEESYPVLVAFLVMYGLNLLGQPGINIIMGTSSIRGMTLAEAGSFLLGIGLGVGIALFTDGGILGLVIALYGPMLIYSIGYVSYRVKREMGVSVGVTFFRCLLPPMLVGMLPVGLGLVLQRVWPVPEEGARIVQFLIAGGQMAFCGAVYMGAAWFLVLSAEERKMVRRLLPVGQGSVSAEP